MTNFGDGPTNRARGEALRRRRLATGIKSVRELQQRSGISREAITSAEAGTASAATYERLDAWFARHEAAGAEVAGSLVEFEVHSDDGIRVVVRGPIADAEELERSVARIIQTIRQSGGPPQDRRGDGGAAAVRPQPLHRTGGSAAG